MSAAVLLLRLCVTMYECVYVYVCYSNVGDNQFPLLPAAGLQHVWLLRAHNNPQLRRFHPPAALPRARTLVLSYAYHCCEFLQESVPPAAPAPPTDDAAALSDFVLVAGRELDAAVWGNVTDLWPHYGII